MPTRTHACLLWACMHASKPGKYIMPGTRPLAHAPHRIQALVQWMQRHARVLTTPAAGGAGGAAASLPDQAEVLHAAERPEQASVYWPVLHRLAAVGWTEDAVGLLGEHSAWQLAYSGARNQQMLALVGIAAAPASLCFLLGNTTRQQPE